jgi:hypothetical protein
MRGIGYLIVQIAVLLVASGVIGYLIGRVLHRRPVVGRASSPPDVASLETKTLVLEGRLSETQDELEEAKRQLTLERLRTRVSPAPDKG